MFPETKRVPLDQAWADELAAFLRSQLEGAPAPGSVGSQVQAVLCAGYLRDLGLIRYAEGASLDEVRKLLGQSSEFTLAVFRFRSVSHADSEVDPDSQPSDESLTNSRRGLYAMELALAGGVPDVASALAPLIWDAEGASYLGPGSVVCTPEDQRLAYALRDLLLDRPDAGLREIRALTALPPEQENRALLLSALLERDPAVFAWALAEQHARHLDGVGHPGLLDTLDDLLDVPTLAYAALGRTRFPGLNPLPTDAFLPLELPFPLNKDK